MDRSGAASVAVPRQRFRAARDDRHQRAHTFDYQQRKYIYAVANTNASSWSIVQYLPNSGTPIVLATDFGSAKTIVYDGRYLWVPGNFLFRIDPPSGVTNTSFSGGVALAITQLGPWVADITSNQLRIVNPDGTVEPGINLVGRLL
jgi:hypothetical protein